MATGGNNHNITTYHWEKGLQNRPKDDHKKRPDGPTCTVDEKLGLGMKQHMINLYQSTVDGCKILENVEMWWKI